MVRGLSVRDSHKGIVLDTARHAVLDAVEVSGIGQEAVRFRTSSADGTIRRSLVHDTGLVDPDYGEGVYIGSAASYWPTYGESGGPDRTDRVVVESTRFARVTAEAVDVKEGTTGVVVRDSTFDGQVSGQHYADSWVDVKGDDTLVTGNTGRVQTAGSLVDGFQVHPNSGWGQRATFSANVIVGSIPGYGIRVLRGATATVRCDNSAPGAALGRANLPCS